MTLTGLISKFKYACKQGHWYKIQSWFLSFEATVTNFGLVTDPSSLYALPSLLISDLFSVSVAAECNMCSDVAVVSSCSLYQLSSQHYNTAASYFSASTRSLKSCGSVSALFYISGGLWRHLAGSWFRSDVLLAPSLRELAECWVISQCSGT